MRVVKRENCLDNTEVLLFEILQELKNISSKLEEKQASKMPILDTKKEVVANDKQEDKKVNCKACGGTHKNVGEMLACSRKMKKK
jgi:hypothetical protein